MTGEDDPPRPAEQNARPAYADGAIALVTFPSHLVAGDNELKPRQILRRKLDALALRVVAGLFTGSMRQLALVNGVSVQALSQRAQLMAQRTGIELHFKSEATRAALSISATRHWRQRRQKAAARCDAGSGQTSETRFQ